MLPEACNRRTLVGDGMVTTSRKLATRSHGAGAKGVATRFWSVLRAAVDRFSDCDGPRLAASMSYYAVFSLFPLLLALGAEKKA